MVLWAEKIMSKIVLIGSTRFVRAFAEWNARLTLKGHLVYSVALTSSEYALPERDKIVLDYVHMKKIEASDEACVLEVRGYSGESAEREIIIGEALEKRMRYLSK